MNVTVDQLSDSIIQAFKEYTDDVTAGIEKAVDETAEKVLVEVKAAAPSPHNRYRKGFAKNNKCTPGNRRYIVWNKKFYSLVHLLENGHAKQNGGRTRAFPHMGPAERKNCVELEAKVKQIIKNGGA